MGLIIPLTYLTLFEHLMRPPRRGSGVISPLKVMKASVLISEIAIIAKLSRQPPFQPTNQSRDEGEIM